MSPKITVDHLGDKSVIIPAGASFSRRFSITNDWSDISLAFILGITTTSPEVDYGVPSGTAGITPVLPNSAAYIGVRNSANPNLLPGEAGVNFVGSTSVGTVFHFDASNQVLRYFQQGSFNGTTVVTGDGTTNSNRYCPVSVGTDYTGYGLTVLRIIKGASTIGIRHKQVSFPEPLEDISINNIVSVIEATNEFVDGAVVLAHTFDETLGNALDTFFFYIPELAVRIRLHTLVLRNNVGF